MEQWWGDLYRLAISLGDSTIDQHRIASLIGLGLDRAGRILGSSYSLFRPSTADNPLSDLPVTAITGIFDPASELPLISPEYRHQNQAFFIGDPSLLLAGDYLAGFQTWFVAHVEQLRVASCILCNRNVTILAPAVASSTGANAYGGATAATNSILAKNWPASVLAKTHIEIDPTRLPSDTKTSFFEVLLPPIPGVVLSFGLIMQDEIGQSYIISAAELSLSGWRLLAGILTT